MMKTNKQPIHVAVIIVVLSCFVSADETLCAFVVDWHTFIILTDVDEITVVGKNTNILTDWVTPQERLLWGGFTSLINLNLEYDI